MKYAIFLSVSIFICKMRNVIFIIYFPESRLRSQAGIWKTSGWMWCLRWRWVVVC